VERNRSRNAIGVVHNLIEGTPPGPTEGYGPGMAATRPTDERLELGRLGEALAAARLEAAGMRVVDRNWRCRDGEIDLIAAGPGLLVFCEVKTRRGHATAARRPPSRTPSRPGCAGWQPPTWPPARPRPAASAST
jgi:hypothetical protein